jgi:hypothetical protein
MCAKPDSVILPDEHTIASIRDSIRGERFKPVFDVVPALASKLEAVLETLFEQEPELVNPEIYDLDDPPVDQVFNLDHPATYALPEAGTLLQAVSLRLPLGGEAIDKLLVDSGSWGERAVFVGALIVYQDLDTGEGVPAGEYAVLLRREDQALSFELMGDDDSYTGEWELRRLSSPAKWPYSYVATEQICFSQTQMQASLNMVLPGSEQVAEIAASAVDTLRESDLLPSAEGVNVAGALAVVSDEETVKGYQRQLAADEPQGCQPNLVVAAATPFSETAGASFNVAFGVAVFQVDAPVDGPVFDRDGQNVLLEPGTYRLDVLTFEDGTRLGQLVPPDQAPCYVGLEAAEGMGQPVDPDTGEPVPDKIQPPYVILDIIIITYCTVQTAGLPPCPGNPNKGQDSVKLFED